MCEDFWENSCHKKTSFQVHGQPCKGYDLGDSAAEWITSYIGPKAASPYRIIYHDFDTIGNPGNERKNPMAGNFPQLDIKQVSIGKYIGNICNWVKSIWILGWHRPLCWRIRVSTGDKQLHERLESSTGLKRESRPWWKMVQAKHICPK